MITEHDLIQILRMRIFEAGSTKAAAVKMQCSADYLSMVANYKRKPGPAIWWGLGYKKVEMYEKVEAL